MISDVFISCVKVSDIYSFYIPHLREKPMFPFSSIQGVQLFHTTSFVGKIDKEVQIVFYFIEVKIVPFWSNKLRFLKGRYQYLWK